MATERRRHVMYVTRNTEYHCRDRECVGVRDRKTLRWERRHPALRSDLAGMLHSDARLYRNPRPGSKLVFSGSKTVMTSRLLAVARPPVTSLFFYTSLAWSGEINA
jgi:hypothetical protein